MSSKEVPLKSRDDVKAAREAKKLAKQKGKAKENKIDEKQIVPQNQEEINKGKAKESKSLEENVPKSKDEVDRAVVATNIKCDKKKPIKGGKVTKNEDEIKSKEKFENVKVTPIPTASTQLVTEADNITVRNVVDILKDIKNVANEVKDITDKAQNISLEEKGKSDEGKSKAELRAERRAKQEAQRAAKQAATQQKVATKPKEEVKPKPKPVPETSNSHLKEATPPKVKTLEKPKSKPQNVQKDNWFQHLYKEHDKEFLKKVPINSNLHPAIVKLGVQSATKVVKGSNARCIALLDALKKMVRDYSLPAKTEFARGLESHLASSLEYLWSMRPASASQTNAIKYFRHHLTQLPNNVDEFDAKKTLQEEIDRYIREQIDMAGEAISLAVRNKIADGDNILTYGCSSLIERILREAWSAGVSFRTIVVGNRVHRDGAEMLRRLSKTGLACTYVDITALSFLMNTVNVSKVVLGAEALLVNGSVLGAAGTAQVAAAARAHNVSVLVACETHKFSERVQTDAFGYNEIGDPDELIDPKEVNGPLKDWQSNPNLTPLNLTYDVTPPSLVTAVVTELSILPCTSAPVVLRLQAV